MALIGLAIFCGLFLWLVLNKTKSGKIVLAVIHNPEISGCMGVNINKVYLAAFFVGAFLAALAGSFTAPLISVQVGISVAVVIVLPAPVATSCKLCGFSKNLLTTSY